LAAAGTSNPTIQCINFLRLLAFKHGFPILATVQLLCICFNSLCLRALLVSLGPDVHQALLKACFGACAEADLHVLQYKEISEGDLESSLWLHADKNKTKVRIEQLG